MVTKPAHLNCPFPTTPNPPKILPQKLPLPWLPEQPAPASLWVCMTFHSFLLWPTRLHPSVILAPLSRLSQSPQHYGWADRLVRFKTCPIMTVTQVSDLMHLGLNLLLCEMGMSAPVSQGCRESEMRSRHKPGMSWPFSEWR